ncbi:MAG: cysteine hydrolase [Leptospiraceae bacterium]|nr:cysteine hydrolase [Leptospiraceae bacterium]
MTELNPEFINIDPLKQDYHDSVTHHPDRTLALQHRNAALLCIDMQYLDAAPGYGVFAAGQHSGVPPEAEEYYFNSLHETVFPNVRRLQDEFRSQKLEVIHVRIQSLTADGRDRSEGHKRLGLHAAPGSKEAEFIEIVAPLENEIIVNKTASGVFNATNLDYILKNMKIEFLYITGVYTNECVSTSVRDACDRGFFVTLIEDACTTVTQELQDYTITVLKDRYARVMNTAETIKTIRNYAALQTLSAN